MALLFIFKNIWLLHWKRLGTEAIHHYFQLSDVTLMPTRVSYKIYLVPKAPLGNDFSISLTIKENVYTKKTIFKNFRQNNVIFHWKYCYFTKSSYMLRVMKLCNEAVICHKYLAIPKPFSMHTVHDIMDQVDKRLFVLNKLIFSDCLCV